MFKVFYFLSFLIFQVGCFKQPNIVLILADDLGYNDVGYRGNNQVKTPNIDALAYNGAILDNFYTLPICTPSRAALMTGNYPIRSGFQGLPMPAGEERHLPFNMPTLPEQLKKLGYETHLVGKWHLGYAYRNVTPIARGFDTHYGYYNGYFGYFDHSIAQENMNGLDFRNNFEINHDDDHIYATDLFTNRAIKIIDSHNDTNPLFLMLSHLAPHTGKTLAPKVTILEERNTEEMNKEFGYIEDVNRRRYVDIVKSLDDSIGLVVRALEKREILDDTFILFMSDNGGITKGNHENFASNWPLKGLKTSNYQGGIKGTAVFYSKYLKYNGKTNTNLMHITDLLPTFYAAGGGNPTDLGDIDGINQLYPLLLNKPTAREEILVNIDEVLKGSAIISKGGRYKLIQGIMSNGTYDDYFGVSGRLPQDGSYDAKSVLNSPTNLALSKQKKSTLTIDEVLKKRKRTSTKNCRGYSNYNVTCDLCLFDLHNDPCERMNLIKIYSKLVKELKERINYFYEQLVPQQNKPVDPKSNPDLYEGAWTYWLDDNPY